jgi:DNA invertase Pin-like site-specific DNA recombinase
MFSLQVLGAVA